MGASHFLWLLLAIGLAQASQKSHSSLPSVNQKAQSGFRSWLWSALFKRYWPFWLLKNMEDGQESIYQDGGEDLDRFDTPRATANDMHGAHFGGDYAFPRYGGQSRMSRYGIDYGDYHARRHGFRGPYNYRPDARSFGAPSDAAFHDGLAYPRWTGHFSGQEHPTTFDPYLTNPYYRDPFHAQRFVAQYPYFRI